MSTLRESIKNHWRGFWCRHTYVQIRQGFDSGAFFCPKCGKEVIYASYYGSVSSYNMKRYEELKKGSLSLSCEELESGALSVASDNLE